MKPRRAVGLTIIAIVDLIFGFFVLFLILRSIHTFDKLLELIIGLPVVSLGFFTLAKHTSPAVKIANSVLALIMLIGALVVGLQPTSYVLLWWFQVLYSLWVLVYLFNFFHKKTG